MFLADLPGLKNPFFWISKKSFFWPTLLAKCDNPRWIQNRANYRH